MSLQDYLQTFNTKKIIVYFAIIIALAIFTYYYHLFTYLYFYCIAGVTLAIIFLYPFIKGYSFQIFTFMITIISGVYGFSTENYRQDYSVLNSIYSTIRLFTLDTDQVFNEEGLKYVNYPLTIEIARWSAVAYIMSTILKLVMNFFDQSVQKFIYRLFGNHIVIFGLNKKTEILAKSLLKKKKKKHKVLIIQENNDWNSEELKEKGAIILKGNLLEESTFKKAAIHKAKYLIALHDKDAVSLDIIHSVHQFLKVRGNRTIPFYIQQNHYLTQSLFDSIEEKVSNTKGTNLELHPVSLHSLIARQLLDKHPLYLGYEERAKDPNGNPFHLLFIGFGLTGQQIAIQAIQRAHFKNNQPLHITVVDREARKIEQQWLETIPRLNDCVKVNFIKKDIEDHNIGNYINEHNTKVTHIYICLDQDEQDTIQGIRLHQQTKEIPIFIKLQGSQHFANWLHEDSNFTHLYRFGAWEEVLTEEMVINEELDEMAKKVHEFYLNSRPGGKPWTKLSLFLKNSNRAQVDHLETKLFLLGLSITDTDSHNLLEDDDFQEKISSEFELDMLAKIEHQRWNVFHFMNGWDTLPIDQFEGNHRDTSKKLHGCLVPWEELPKVSEKAGYNFWNDDRNTVKSMNKLVRGIKKYISTNC